MTYAMLEKLKAQPRHTASATLLLVATLIEGAIVLLSASATIKDAFVAAMCFTALVIELHVIDKHGDH